MFEENPCRWNEFEIFRIDRSMTDQRAIRLRVSDTREIWNYQEKKVVLRNGEKRAIEEARLNEFQGRLDDPLQRLKDEQFVHQFHSFAGDEELSSAVRGLAETELPVSVPTVAGAALLSAVGPLLPDITPPVLEDDLPWPQPPAAFDVEQEPLEDAMLRNY
jgi:hypothetical protein